MTPFQGKTWGEVLGPAMKITDPADAAHYFAAYVNSIEREAGSREKAEALARANLGYYAGYYDSETRLRVERLFFCAHPIFGPAANGTPTPEEAFRLGVEAGRNAAGKVQS